MLQQVLEFVQAHPGANSYDVCQKFGITRALSERLLETLEDAGELTLERPAAGCSTGGGCGTGGGAAGKLQELAQAARERAAARREAQAEQAQ